MWIHFQLSVITTVKEQKSRRCPTQSWKQGHFPKERGIKLNVHLQQMYCLNHLPTSKTGNYLHVVFTRCYLSRERASVFSSKVQSWKYCGMNDSTAHLHVYMMVSNLYSHKYSPKVLWYTHNFVFLFMSYILNIFSSFSIAGNCNFKGYITFHLFTS